LREKVKLPGIFLEWSLWLGSFENMGWRSRCLPVLHEEAERVVQRKAFDIFPFCCNN
jgi:hypothetical protein